MSILRRFKDIMASNINSIFDKVEDPEKMIDQYLRNLNSDLGKVKAETASIMAKESRAKRQLKENEVEIEKMQSYAIKALQADNENDARSFLENKAKLVEEQVDLKSSYELAVKNTIQMKQMHDKLVSDVENLEARRANLKGKAAMAKTQDRLNKINDSVSSASSSLSAFDRMEEKINQSYDEAQAIAELNKTSEDDIKKLTEKYENNTDSYVEDELASLKASLNKN